MSAELSAAHFLVSALMLWTGDRVTLTKTYFQLVTQFERVPGLAAQVLDPGLNGLGGRVRGLPHVLQGLVEKDVAARLGALHDYLPVKKAFPAHTRPF